MGGVRMAERASESEMQVLSALWDKSPQTAADLTSRIGKINGWTQATVKTLLALQLLMDGAAGVAEGQRQLGLCPVAARGLPYLLQEFRTVCRPNCRSEEHTSALQSLMR